MDTNTIKELIEKVKNKSISNEEKLELIKILTKEMEEYNRVLREALVAIPETKK